MGKGKKIGLALGGGGARGLAHIGVLKVLEEAGIKPDIIAGVSMGGFIGAAYALGRNSAEIENIALRFQSKTELAKMLDPGLHRRSILKGEKILNFVKSIIGEADFKDASVPLRIVATDLQTGKETVFKKGRIFDAIKASICVPGIFPPALIDGRYYIDGGVVNPTPTDILKKMNADVIIGVDLVMKRDIELHDPGIATTLLQSYEIIRTQAVQYKLQTTNGRAIIIKPKLRGPIDSFKFYYIDKFIKSGEEAAKEILPEIYSRLNA